MACRTAADGFSDIVGKVGGEQEKARARFDCNAFTNFQFNHVSTP